LKIPSEIIVYLRSNLRLADKLQDNVSGKQPVLVWSTSARWQWQW